MFKKILMVVLFYRLFRTRLMRTYQQNSVKNTAPIYIGAVRLSNVFIFLLYNFKKRCRLLQ